MPTPTRSQLTSLTRRVKNDVFLAGGSPDIDGGNALTAPQSILQLVERFDLHRDAYQSPGYHETQVRREFIDPMFKALGWDVDNRSGYAEQWKEVVHEDALKVGGATKAPDYSFRLGGRRFVGNGKIFQNDRSQAIRKTN
ncbi:hypothetical protein ACFL34_04940 [Candidatus Sumerlaeota bacterium]